MRNMQNTDCFFFLTKNTSLKQILKEIKLKWVSCLISYMTLTPPFKCYFIPNNEKDFNLLNDMAPPFKYVGRY
jgi:hypothetical protein